MFVDTVTGKITRQAFFSIFFGVAQKSSTFEKV